MTYDDILHELETLRNPDALPGMAKFGITPERAYGVRIPELRRIAKTARGKDKAANHALAAQLWTNNARETRILAKGINWALRQIGKRNQALNQAAIKTAVAIQTHYPDSKAAQWVARDTLRE